MKKLKLVGITGLLVLVFACLIIFFKIRVIKYNDDTYIKWSDKQVSEKVENLANDTKIKVISSLDGNTTDVPMQDLGINFKLLDDNDQEITKFPRLFDLNQVLSYYIEDTKIFKNYFKDMNKNLSKSKNAYYKKTNKDIVLHKEVVGSRVDISKLYDTCSTEIENGNLVVDMNDFIVEPSASQLPHA